MLPHDVRKKATGTNGAVGKKSRCSFWKTTDALEFTHDDDNILMPRFQGALKLDFCLK